MWMLSTPFLINLLYADLHLEMLISSSEFICWNPNVWCDSIRKWNIGEVIRSCGWDFILKVMSPHEGISVLAKRLQRNPSPLLSWGHKRYLWMSQEVGPHESHQICWHCGFGLPRLQKEMFDVYEFPCLWYLLQQPSGTKTKFCLFQCLKSTSCFTNNLLVPTP